MFALFLLWQATKSSARTILSSFMDPQASPPSAAQPAVMGIRCLWRRFLEKIIDEKNINKISKQNKQKIKSKK